MELNARYLDALVLLVREQGKLVSKDRFMDEVWQGVPVTDEALTQCIRTIRKRLGDDAGRPRFIETVPKHGYRFIAPVDWLEDDLALRTVISKAAAEPDSAPRSSWRQVLLLGAAGTAGGTLAGAVGGLFYGFAGSAQPAEAGMGAVSVVIVLVIITALVGLIGGAGVGLGIAAAGRAPNRLWLWSTLGGACGGLVVGAIVKLVGLDAFNLLFGQSPGEITGAPEGALLGGAVGFGAWLASRTAAGARSLRRGMAAGALTGGIAGAVIPQLGGRLMGGSLDLLARRFPESRFQMSPVGALFGEDGFGPVSQIVTGGLEIALFGGCLVGAISLARRAISGAG